MVQKVQKLVITRNSSEQPMPSFQLKNIKQTIKNYAKVTKAIELKTSHKNCNERKVFDAE